MASSVLNMVEFPSYEASRHEAELLELMSEFCAESGLAFDRELRAENVRKFVAAGDSCGRIWMAESSGKVAGYLVLSLSFSFEFNGRDAFVDEIYFRPEFRRQGLGSTSLEFVEREAEALEVRQLHLEADLEDQRLKPFYEKAGYVARGYRLFSKKL